MKNKTHKIPEEVIQTFKEWLGPKIAVDPSKIVCFPSDGYRDYQHGEFDLYVLRHDGGLYKVWKYENGYLYFK